MQNMIWRRESLQGILFHPGNPFAEYDMIQGREYSIQGISTQNMIGRKESLQVILFHPRNPYQENDLAQGIPAGNIIPLRESLSKNILGRYFFKM